jgi:hypothetical protein
MNLPSKFRLSLAAVSMLGLAALGLYGQANPSDISSVKDGIGRLKGLPASVQEVVKVIGGTNFGPFEMDGRCEYDWNWYCFGNCYYYKWSWAFPNYTWLKTDLQGKYQRVQNQASQFDAAFSPVRAWLTGSLPNISQQMDAAFSRMQAGDAASVKNAVEQLDSQLNSSSSSLETGYKNLSGFNKTLNTLLEQANSRTAMEDVISRDQAAINGKVATYPCGAEEARNKYNGIRDTVRNQFSQVEAATRTFGVTSTRTDQDVSLVLGTLLTARGNVSSVLKSLQNASVTPAGAVQRLRLNVVAGQWRDLSDYARTQFGR